MQRLSMLFTALSATVLWNGGATAQSYVADPSNHLRVEEKEGGRMLIGAEDGRNYVRSVNLSAAPVVFRLQLSSFADPETGALQEETMEIPLDAHGLSEKIYFNAQPDGAAWMNGWSVSTGDAQSDTPAPARDAAPFFRAPPRYPEDCMATAAEEEYVDVSFDVSKEGRIENLLIRNMSNGCLALAAHRSVREWIYAPKIVDGVPVASKDMETRVTFILTE